MFVRSVGFLGPLRTERLNGRWKANDKGLSAAPLTSQHRCKFRRLETIRPTFTSIGGRTLLALRAAFCGLG
jgi:hypothetical protein